MENEKISFWYYWEMPKDPPKPRLLTVLSLFLLCFYIMFKSKHLPLTQADKLCQVEGCMSVLHFSACKFFFCFTCLKRQRPNLFSCRWGHLCWSSAADCNKKHGLPCDQSSPVRSSDVISTEIGWDIQLALNWTT